ncbi:MAG: sodium-translocating pyrophosphatase [Euryarchaeota archaeon]|nr:sodium-translocating pyrophosphatase [Euryarchaeota archaeon]
MEKLVLISFLSSIFAIGYALYLRWSVLKMETGTPKMVEIYGAIREGAKAFLYRQYKTIAVICTVLSLILYFVFDLGAGRALPLTAAAVLTGTFCSLLAGFIGMDASTSANVRCTAAAKKGMHEALTVAFRGGAVTGLAVVGSSLFGVTLLYYLYAMLLPGIPAGAKPLDPVLIVGLGFGASFAALFAQLGGGIYTKAADVGADLVGKVEAGIPEDDPRNPAVVADLVGDNVGDCAGRGADLFESITGENIGAMILGFVLWPVYGIGGIMFPLIARCAGIIATILGMAFVRPGPEETNPMRPLNMGLYASTVLCAVAFYILVQLLLKGNMGLFYAAIIGLATSVLITKITEYYTERDRQPVISVAKSSMTGPATTIITGISVGLESTALPVVLLTSAILLAYKINADPAYPGLIDPAGIYGTAIATMGMLAITPMILAFDVFGPISDNAGGIAEMANLEEDVRKNTDRLDAAGNTTKALTKGYAMGSATLAAFLLFSAYLTEVTHLSGGKVDLLRDGINIAKPEIFVGVFIGAALPFLFSSLAIKAVGRAAFQIVEEVRRQFREIKGIMEGTAKPEYGKCVDIVTKASLREMVAPSMLVLIVPVAVGLLLGAEAVGGLLMGATISGVLLAMFMNNGGAAWDNAKKYIEAGNLGGKRLPTGEKNPTHAASVIGDTVGDPLKDTAGPSLHVLVKLINTISLIFAPLFV